MISIVLKTSTNHYFSFSGIGESLQGNEISKTKIIETIFKIKGDKR